MSDTIEIADAIRDALVVIDAHGDERTVTDALYAIAKAIENLAVHVKYLGNGDAATQMGAIEAFGMHIGNKIDSLADAIREASEK